MMKPKRAVSQLHVDMSSEDKVIKLKNDAGQDVELNNIIIIGGHSDTEALYIFAEGFPKDIAETLASVFKWSRIGKTDQQHFFSRMFSYFLRNICDFFGFSFDGYPRDVQIQSIRTQAEAEALLTKWEKEDKESEKKKEGETRWN